MPLPVVDRAIHVATRRCWVPADLESVTAIGDANDADPVVAEIWGLVEDVYRSGMHPGIQICIRHRGDVVMDRAIGHARGNLPGYPIDPDRLTPMAIDTPVNLFSAAKAVTAMAMHKLEELGALDLDDPVAEYVAGFERHGKGSITIRQVLTHRAGIPTFPARAFDLDLLTDHERLTQILCDLRPSSPPGATPAYHAVSGGFVMEAVARGAADRSLRDVLATEIKEPLGLGWFDYGVAPEHAQLVAQNVETGLPVGPALGTFMRRVLGRGWSRVLRMSNDPRFLSGVIPSANVIVTARDAATFYQCLMNGGSVAGTRVFDETTVAGAVAPVQALEIDRMLGVPMRYSSGFMLGSESVSLYGWNHPRIFGHLGMSNLFTWADPERDLAVAFLATGKPVFGSHLPPLVRLISGIHERFPAR